MLTVKLLNTPKLIEDAAALLYEVYIEQHQWKFEPDNPSYLRIEERNGRKLLLDRFTPLATWFGVFDKSKLIGCARLCGVDKNFKLEIEGYSSSFTVHGFLPEDRSHCVELTKVAVCSDYLGKGIVIQLFLAAFNYCEQNKYSIISCTHNGYLKSLFKKIRNPLKLEHAFKYEEQDPMPVNFYFADYHKSEVAQMIFQLKKFNTRHSPLDILKALEIVAPILPTPVYWHDTQGVLLGINEHCLKAIGSSHEIIGRTPYEFYPKEIAEYILNHNELVMRTEQVLSQEEKIKDITTGQTKYFSSIKAPLYDEEGNIIGIVGSSIETTAEKEAEELRVRNKAQQLVVEELNKFKRIAGQVLHDIQSPISSIRMIVDSTPEIPEEKRIALRTAAINVSDITNQLLKEYRPHSCDKEETDYRQSILVSSVLLEVMEDRRYKHKDTGIIFEYELTPLNAFQFIKVQPLSFKRSISNLVNNAIDSLDKPGKITVKLEADDEWVQIYILDNGCGMPPQMIEKIKNNESFTEGKKQGCGIGLSQVKDMLNSNYGTLDICSSTNKKNHGTTVRLKFPKAFAPTWSVQEIKLTETSIITVLDDDITIHGAWNSKLANILERLPNIQVKHFYDGQATIDFIASLSKEEKDRVCLLSDYELINQNLNGLEVIKQCNVNSAILVSSHYSDLQVRETAEKERIKLLPKDLAHIVPINLQKSESSQINPHMVFVDDDINYVNTLVATYYSNYIVEQYNDPLIFLEQYEKYPKDTKIILDNYYNKENGRAHIIDGIEIAEKLYAKGYKKLFLLSAERFEVPKYLKLILKEDRNNIIRIDKL